MAKLERACGLAVGPGPLREVEGAVLGLPRPLAVHRAGRPLRREGAVGVEGGFGREVAVGQAEVALLIEVVDRIEHEGAREVVREWLTARL